jgi:transposase
MFSIKPKTLFHWYKNIFSHYKKDIAGATWGEKSIETVDEDTGEVKEKKCVEIVRSENFGEQMSIDEKQIGKEMHTIMTNNETGKIAMLVSTMKITDLSNIVKKYLTEKSTQVKSISCDMSPSYKKFCRENFENTELVIDKFHVVKHIIDAMQQVRKTIKTNLTLEESKQAYDKWTTIEMLDRARYILVKYEEDWKDDEKKIMKYLFKHFTDLQNAYNLTTYIRTWYNKQNVGKPMYMIEKDLYHWCDMVLESKLTAFRAVRKMMEKHHDDIINYFKKGTTNAKAENMNGKIQRFIASNYGIREKDFFMYRLKGYFA